MRTLLVAIAALAIVFGWVARARQQRDVVAALRASNPGIGLLYNYQAADSGRGLRSLPPDRFERLRRRVGVDYFSSVAAIRLNYPTDAELRLVSRLRTLRKLYLQRAVDATDEGLSRLHSLSNLTELVLSDAASVSDVGVGYLSELTSLEELSFTAGRLVTSEGILKLAKLKRLKRLELSCHNAAATAAVDEVRRRLPNCQIRGSSADDIR